MATPRVGADGRRRLTVTITLVDDEADVLWAAAALRYGKAAAGVSKLARTAVRSALAAAAKDPQVQATVRNLRQYQTDEAEAARRPRLRLVK